MVARASRTKAMLDRKVMGKDIRKQTVSSSPAASRAQKRRPAEEAARRGCVHHLLRLCAPSPTPSLRALASSP